MLKPNKYNAHKFLFVASAGALLLSGIAWLVPENELIRIIVKGGLLPSTLLMFLLGLLIWVTGFRHPEDDQKLAHGKAHELLEKLAQSPVGCQLTDASRKVIRIADLIEDHNYPELHVYGTLLDELYQLVPACLLPRHYGENGGPILDWHKYDLCIIAAEEDVESAKNIKNALLHLNGDWRIYLEAVDREAILEEQERFIKRVFYGGSLKCLALLSIHMINHARSKQELQFAMQRGQISDEVCRNYLMPMAIDKFGLNFMDNDAYLRKYSGHSEIIRDRIKRFDAIVKKLSKLLKQSIFYLPSTAHEPEQKDTKKRFAIALTYPSEHRRFVESIAEELRQRLNDEEVFYDRYFIAELARIDLDTYLQQIYSEQAELVVVFLCAEYEAKKWCELEWRAVRELIMRKQSAAIMLIRFDQTDIPGVFSHFGYIEAEYLKPEAVADLIIRRLFLNRRS